MGWETVAFVGLSAVSAASGMSNANKQAKATIREGELVAKNKARETSLRAASQRVSFLNSGLTLEGTPENVIGGTFDTGIADIKQINSNYNARASNIMSQARTQAISGLASSFALSSMAGGASSLFDKGLSFLPESAITSLNGTPLVNNAYNALALKDARF